jgi:hypothetical protein
MRFGGEKVLLKFSAMRFQNSGLFLFSNNEMCCEIIFLVRNETNALWTQLILSKLHQSAKTGLQNRTCKQTLSCRDGNSLNGNSFEPNHKLHLQVGDGIIKIS